MIFYDGHAKELSIGVLRANTEKEEYLASLDPSHSNSLLPRAASKPRLLVERVFRADVPRIPKLVCAFSGFGRNEFTVAVHSEKGEVNFIDAEVAKDDALSFRLARKCENILSIARVEDKYCTESDSIPRLCRPKLEENSLFIGRLEQIKSCLAALDGNNCIHIFKGSQIIFSIDLSAVDMKAFCTAAPYNLSRSVFRSDKPARIEGGLNWRLNVITNKETQVKLSLEILQQSPLVKAILQAIQAVVSKNLFICFYSDYLEILHVP